VGKDKFKVLEEEMLENSLVEKSIHQEEEMDMPEVSLGSVMAVYRNLRKP
jgi:hypothetical protein